MDSASGTAQVHRPFLALGYMAGGVLCLCILDATTKWLTSGYGTWQLVFACRVIPIAASVVMAYHETGHVFAFRTSRWKLHLFRGVLGLVTVASFFEALRHMPLADAVAIGFAAPLFVTVLSGPILKEKIGRQRWIAVIVGFVGVVLAFQPGAGIGVGPLLALLAALAYALMMVTLRPMSGKEPTRNILLYSNAFSFLAAAPLAISEWVTPNLFDGSLFLIQGAMTTAGGLLMIRAFRYGEASLLAPVEYTALLWSVLFGVALFDQFPGREVIAGAALIIAASFYLAHRERIEAQKAA